MIINADCYNITTDRMDLLWENEDPTTEFASNTVLQINVYHYKLLYISFYESTTSKRTYTQIYAPRSESTTLICDYGKYRYYRSIYNSSSHLQFGGGCYCEHQSDGASSYGDNKYVIPYRVYGLY